MRLAVATVAFALVVTGCGPDGARPLQGYVEGEYVRVAAPFAGTLQQLSVKRGDQVAAAAPLFALERENESAARREAEGRLSAAEARLANLRSGKRPPEVEAAAEQLQQARAMRELSAANARRQQQLFASGFISGAALDDTRAQVARDDARVKELEAVVAMTKLAARADEIRAADADARAACEVVAQSAWRLAQRAVAATIAFIADRAEFTPPVLYSKENRSKLVYLVEAKPALPDAAKLHPGQPIDVTLPAP